MTTNTTSGPNPLINFIDTSLSRNRHRLLGPTYMYRRAIKEKSKVDIRKLIYLQSCSLFQYIFLIRKIILIRILLS